VIGGTDHRGVTERPPTGYRARITVRRVDLSPGPVALAAAAARLSPAELLRAERGTDAVRARRILVRAALRELLGEILGLPAREVPLAARPGRPALVPAAGRADLDMSCSASGDVGLVAVVRAGRIGVDVQRVHDGDPDTALAEGWLSVAERNRIVDLPAREQPEALARAWVQKEAVLKGQGIGLRADMTCVRSLSRETGRIGRWSISPVDVPTGYVGCVAVRAAGLLGSVTRLPVLV